MATLQSTTELLQLELAAVEELMRRRAASEVEVLREAAQHILGAGGKRFRPQILMLSAQAAGGSLSRAIPLAAAAELVHTATLVHDDIVDGSESRRGRASVQLRFGSGASVLMGDYLVVRAFELVAEDGDFRLMRLLLDTIARMCEGEVLQIGMRGDIAISLAEYERVIESKTALLTRACGRFGAYLGDAGARVVEALSDYGYHVGMAFQIADDILDFTGDEAVLGKPVGSDFRERKVTLPLIFALASLDEAGRRDLERLCQQPGPLGRAEAQQARRMIEAAGGFDRARRHGLEYARSAVAALAPVAPSPARDALVHLAEQVVDRRA